MGSQIMLQIFVRELFVFMLRRNLNSKKKKFVDAFKKHYRPGLFGGHWNRPFLKRPMTMGSIKAYAESYPNSATARAVKEVMTLTNQLQPPLQKPRYWYSS